MEYIIDRGDQMDPIINITRNICHFENYIDFVSVVVVIWSMCTKNVGNLWSPLLSLQNHIP